MIRVVIVGGGNLAESIALAISGSAQLELVQIYLRSAERGAELSALTGAPFATEGQPLAPAELYLLAVSDGAVGELSRTLDFSAGAVVAHTAGSLPLETIAEGLNRAVLYPMQTFTRGRRVDFGSIPIFVEAESGWVQLLINKVANALSSSVMELSSPKRRELHLSAVFVCNFVNAMFSAGEELVASTELPFEILKPLIEESCAKALESSSPRALQTGPARRGDTLTQSQHLEMLSGREDLSEIYKTISKYIWETSKRI